MFLLVVGAWNILLFIFQLTASFTNYICSLSHLFFSFLFQKLGWRENWKKYPLLFLTTIINFQDSQPNLLYSNDSSRDSFQSVANLIRFSIFFGGASKAFLKASSVNIYVENEEWEKKPSLFFKVRLCIILIKCL